MDMTPQEYGRYVAQLAPKSPLGRNCLKAFVIGGAICCLGQWLLERYQALGLSREAAGPAVTVTLIFLAALLTGLGLYDRIARHAGAGTLVPVTGFANAVAAPAMEFRSEGLVTGVAAKLFTVAGPVLVYGISASVVYGVILWLTGG